MTRLWNLSGLPSGLNQDEAFAGFEAYNLLRTGMDSWLNPWPVYFVAWGSGMNVLYSYLTMPFIALFGLEVWVVRLPQAIFGILSCYLFYRLVSLMFDKRAGLVGFFLITICPWHIMLSRWGLESNLAPFFILSGFYFFARSIKNIRYLLLCALLYGLGLYAYATAWIYISLTFGAGLLYLLWYKRSQRSLFYVFCAGTVFALLALPLFLFILINNGMIDEIKTAYFSIPKLLYWRQGEVGIDHLNLKLPRLWRVLVYGDDYLITNRMEFFGLFYPFSLLFVLLGLWQLFIRAKKEVLSGYFSLTACVLGAVLIGIGYGAMLYPCINRLNFLWFNLMIAITAGIYLVPKNIRYVVFFCYGVFFVFFIKEYATKYNTAAERNFTPDLKEALEVAEDAHSHNGLPITILGQPFIYPKVWFYQKISTELLKKTLQWEMFSNDYLDAQAFTHYYFEKNADYANKDLRSIYILPKQHIYYFYQFDTKRVGAFAVAIPR